VNHPAQFDELRDKVNRVLARAAPKTSVKELNPTNDRFFASVG